MTIPWMEEGKGFWRLGRRSVVRPWFNDHYRNQFDAWFSEKLIRKKVQYARKFHLYCTRLKNEFCVKQNIFMEINSQRTFFLLIFPEYLIHTFPKKLNVLSGTQCKENYKNILEIEIIFWKNVPSNLLKWNFLLKKDLKIAKKI